MASLTTLRRALPAWALMVMLPLSGCITVPRAPIDPATRAKELADRSLDDPKVTAALEKAGLPIPGEIGWTLDALTIAAWTLRTDLAVITANVTAGQAAEEVAEELPNPTLTIDPSYVTKNATGNISPWTVAAAIGFTIETGGKRGIRKAQAKAETESRRWQLAGAFWKARQEVRKAMLARQFSQRSLALAERELTLRESASALTETLIKYGNSGQTERLIAQTNLAQARAQLRTARGEAVATETELAAALGIDAQHLPRLAPISAENLPDPATTDAGLLREWGVVNRLSVRQALADYAIAEEDLRMALAKQYPDFTVGPGYTYDKADHVVTMSFGLTLPIFHGERAAIDQAVAVREKAARSFDQTQAQTIADIDAAVLRYKAASAALTEAGDSEAAARRASAATDNRLSLGGADRGEVLAAQLGLVLGERAHLDARRAALESLTAMEDSVERPIWPESHLTMEPPAQSPSE